MMQSQSSHSSRDSADMKRPKTAWGRFLEDYKKTVGGCEGIGKFNEIQKTASAMWKNMSQADKAVRHSLTNTTYLVTSNFLSSERSIGLNWKR